MDIPTIKARMASRKLRQVDLANLLEISPVQINKSLQGNRRFTYPEMRKIEAFLDAPTPSDDGGGITQLPVIGQVAAGRWREAVQQPVGWIPVLSASAPQSAFALAVVGDSMDLEIGDGGTVIVDPDDKALYPGRLYVVLNADGEATFKQFEADPARLMPRSSNPAHQAIQIGDGSAFTLVGRVTALYRTR